MNGAQPEPEIIPPGQDSGYKDTGYKERGFNTGNKDFDDMADKAQQLMHHPMTWPRVAYVLYALSIITGVPMLVGVIVAYVARGEAPAWQRSHYTFLIRTFWYFIALALIGAVLAFVLVGFVILWVLPLWMAIRVIRGWMLLENKQPVPNPESWLFG